jgi:uncharacterized protein
MTSEQPTAPSPPPPASWPALDLRECRVLGVLIEKAKTTPDAYPLSLNALVTGCNQKSNRDPVTNLDEADVENTLAGLHKRLYVQKVVGGRVERWRHVVYEAWHVNKVELAVLAELLLRGPQTEGELRTRASRMEPIDDLDALRPILRSLAERGLVVYLIPEGRRGTTLSHGFQSPADLDRLRSAAPCAEPSPGEHPIVELDRVGPLESRLIKMEEELEALRTAFTQVQQQVAVLSDQLSNLKKQLGS